MGGLNADLRYEADDLQAWAEENAGEPSTFASSAAKRKEHNGNGRAPKAGTALPEYFDDVLDNWPEIQRRWVGDASGLKDSSASAIDLSLATLLAIRTKYDDDQLATCIRERRRRCGDDLSKIDDRDDYLVRTIAKAHEDTVRARAEELVAEVEQLKNPTLVWDAIDLIARLPKAHGVKTRSQLKKILGKDLNLNEFDAAVREAHAQAANANQSRRRGNRPVIITERQECDIIEKCIDVLHKSNDPPRLFVQNAAPVRVDRDEDGRPMIRRADTAMIGQQVHRFADVVRHRGRDDQEIPDRLTVETMRRLLASESFPFPTLEAIVESPLLRPDGSIIDTPGYDASTRLYTTPSRRTWTCLRSS